MNLHPISQILNFYLTEKDTIASNAIVNTIKGDFKFESSEIEMISLQLYNNNLVSKMIPKTRFTIKFDAKSLDEILKSKKTSQNILYILLSCVSWIIDVENTQIINNFDLILNLLDSFPDTIGVNTVLSIYRLTNYFFECILRLNQEYSYGDVEYQTMRFLDRYKKIYQTELIYDTLLNWLKIGYSFENQTSFTQSILSYTGTFAQENLSLFPDSIFDEICNIIQRYLSVFNSFELCFLIKFANMFPPNILLNNINFLIESILPYFKLKNDIQYKVFDKDKYAKSTASNTISNLSQFVSVFPQFSSFKYAYQNEVYIIPCSEVKPSSSFSDSIFKIIKRIFQICENGKIFKYEEFSFDHLNSLFENILIECINNNEMQKYYFDSVAAILSFIQLYNNFCDNKYDTHQIFQILINSPLFDQQLTIFTENSENESVHKLRMVAYYLLIFQNEQNIQLFFTLKKNFPLMISEFFSYGLNYKKYKSTIPKEILDSQIFLDNIYQIILSYLNKGETKENLKISETKKIDASSFSSFDMKQIESSIADMSTTENNSTNNNNIPLQESYEESQADQESGNKLSNEFPSHFKTHSSLLLTNEYDESQQSLTSEIFDVNSSFASFQSNSSQQISLNESCIENSSQKLQSAQIPKIHHRKPISDSKNNFLKWFNAIKKDDKTISTNIAQEKYSLDNLIECTLVHALVFITNIIENDEEVASLWNESTNLASLFFHLLFNEFIRPIILNILFRIWSSKKSSVTMYSQDFIANVFEQNYDDDYSLLDLQLLETINLYLYHKMNVIIELNYSNNANLVSMNDKEFNQVIEPFIRIYQLITSIMINCDISSDFLHNLMILFSFYTKTIKRKARAAISSALLRVEGKNPDKKFYHDFILIITSFNNYTESSEFLITQPKMVSVFIESFSESNFLSKIFEYIQSLCENSVANTIACHAGNVDITLIKYIYKHKESSFIPKALQLFLIIATTASSIPVVSQFISLFCPIKSHFSPPYMLDCIQTFTKIISAKQTQPTAYLPISKKSPHVEILKLTKNKVYQGFTFTARLFIDKFAQKFQSKLLQISDQNNKMALTIDDNQIGIYSNVMNYQEFDSIVPINVWFNIAVTFVPAKNLAHCQIDNQDVSDVSISFPPFTILNYLTCEVGNGNTSGLFMMHAALIGGFSFYPLEQPFFDFKNNKTTPWISVKFDIDQSLLKIVTEPNQPELNASLVGENLIANLSFTDVLLKFFKAEILIPLFAQIGFPIYNSINDNCDVLKILNTPNLSVNYAKFLHALILVTLTLNDEVQKSFQQSQGFRIISYILQNMVNKSILTLDFYMLFVYLFENLTYQDLSIQLLNNILLNAEIWSLTSVSGIQEIVRYWNNSFLKQKWFLQLHPFFKLILPISIFYQKMSDEVEDQSKLKEIEPARKIIRQFLCNVARLKFTEFDFNALMMTCIVGSNLIFSTDLLYLIQDIAKIENSPFLQFAQSERKYLFNSLDAILKYFDEDEVLLVIETILILHDKKIIHNLKINEHIEIIMISLSKNLCTESFIMKMFELAEKFYPDALPIPFYLILSSYYSTIDSAFLPIPKSLLSIVTKIKPNPVYYVHKLWFIWPLMLAIKNNDILDSMLNFIILSSLKNWINIFVSIYIICYAFDIDPIPIQRKFLILLANHILQEKVTNDVASFIELAFYFIFTKPVNDINQKSNLSVALQYLFKGSVFDTQNGKNQSNFESSSENMYQNSNQSSNENIYQSSNEAITQSSNENMYQNINTSSNENIYQSSNESINKTSNENIYQNSNPSSNENIYQSSNESINQSSNENMYQNSNPSSNEVINQNSNESITKTSNENIYQNSNPSSNENITKTSTESIYQSSTENIYQNSNPSSNDAISQTSNDNTIQSSTDHLSSNSNISSEFKSIQQPKAFRTFFNLFMSKVADLVNNISITDFKFQFDVDKEGNWNDQELCELFKQVYHKHESNKEILQYSSFVHYLEARERKKYNPDLVIKSDLLEMYQSKLKFVGEIVSKIKVIPVYIHLNREKSEQLNKEIAKKIDKVCDDSYQYLNIVYHQKESSKEKSQNLWYDLWRSLTNDRSPWRNSLPLSETHFKRNPRILAYNCPVKLKQNLNYTNHKDASFNREYGSSEMAKEKLINYLRELKEKNKKEAPPPLLSISRNESSSLNYDINDDYQHVDFDTLTIDQQSDFYFKHCYNSSNNYISNRSSPTQSNQNDIPIEKKIEKYDAKLLTLKGQKKIEFGILSSCLKIFYKSKEKGQNRPVKVKQIDASSINCILYRSYLHQGKSFEIVTKSGKSYLINLKRKKSLDLLSKLKSESGFKSVFIQIDTPSDFISKLGYQEKWKNGLMSNFEYLMKLNFYGGRSFNETAIYPVFPWIIKDYSSTKIDIEDESIYRDLSVPIGALNSERLNDLKKHLLDYISFRNVGFLYNSCFISPLCVYLWLIRVEPFTSLHIDLQSGRFDYASRIFTSIPAAFNMVTNHMNDYRELIPEFFYTSSFLENRNHFDLGILRNKPVNDVVLPNWSKSAIEFVYTHRKALESEYINNHLNDWIDLIFGYCQKGEKAVEKNNTFDPCLYEDIWDSEENLNDEAQRKMIKAVLRHCGHIPNQIFNEKHPVKEKFVVKPISDLKSFRPSKEGNFPKSLFTMLFTVKQSHRSISTKKCIFVSNSGILSIASLTIKKDSKETFYSIVSHPSVGPLNHPSKVPQATRKLLEKTASTPLSASPYNINSFGIDSENENMSASSGITDTKKLRINLTIANLSEKSSIFAFSPSNSLLVVATNIGSIIVYQIYGENKVYGLLMKHVGRVNCVAISDNFIVSGGSDTSINIWGLNKENKILYESNIVPLSQQSLSMSPSKQKVEAERRQSTILDTEQSYKRINDGHSSLIRHLKTIQSFRNEITCIDICEKFGTIASGTKDGSIILIDTDTLESTVTIGIAPEVPIMVKITSGWGFVVVYSNKEHEGQIMSYLSVFDIDGQLIRKKQINFEIDCWTQFTSIDGFDFMVFGSASSAVSYQNTKKQENSENGSKDEMSISSQIKFNLYMFEVFYLDIEEAGIKKSDSRFMELKYCVKKGILYTVTENGAINVYPTTELNTKRFHRTIFGND